MRAKRLGGARMSREKAREYAAEIERGCDLVDRLMYVADGGRAEAVAQYDASTVLALLMDEEYRGEVMGRVESGEWGVS